METKAELKKTDGNFEAKSDALTDCHSRLVAWQPRFLLKLTKK